MNLMHTQQFKNVIVFLLMMLTLPASAMNSEDVPEDAEARAEFDRFAAHYRTIDQRHERAVATYSFDTDLKMYQMMSGQTTRAWEYMYVSPDRFWINLETIEVRCDGERLWASQFQTERYVLIDQPAEADLVPTIETILGDWGAMPVSLAMLLSGDRGDRIPMIGGDLVVTGHALERRDSVDCIRFDIVSKDVPSPQGGEPVSFTGAMWFGSESKQLLSIEFDIRETMQKNLQNLSDDEDTLAAMGITQDEVTDEVFRSALMQIEIEDLTDGPVGVHSFQIPDPGDLEQVDSFGSFDWGMNAVKESAAAGDLMPEDFLGEAAPPIQGRDQHGNFIDTVDLRGQIVVVIVGSPFRPNLAASWFREAEKLQGAFGETPMQILGLVSTDDEGMDEIDSLDPDAFKLPIVQDDDGGLIDSFRVSIRPALFLIDRDGIVQAVYGSRSDFKADLLIDEITALLEGDTLYDQDKVNARRDELRQIRAAHEEKAPTLILEEAGTERVRTKLIERWGRNSRAPFEAILQVKDFNGDGVSDVALSDGNARLLVIDGSDLSTETIRFETVESKDVSMVAFDQIRNRDGTGWAVMTSRSSPYSSESTETIGVFLADGTKVRRWTLQPRNSKETIYTHDMDRLFAVGDLDGDGIDEIAVGISMSADYPGSEDVLIVFNASGDVLFTKDVQFGFDTVRIVPSEDGKPGWVATANFSGVFRYEFDFE